MLKDNIHTSENFMSDLIFFLPMVKSNVLDVDVVQSTTSSGTLTVNLSITCPSSANGCNVNQVGNTYYLSGILNGYYYCGLQMGNQSVQYTWTLNISATPTSLASGATVSIEISYFDTYPNKPYYSETWAFTLNSNGQASGEFSACMVPSSVFPESSVGIKVTSVKSATDQPINYTSSAIGIIPE
jgi:hypothetical protein